MISARPSVTSSRGVFFFKFTGLTPVDDELLEHRVQLLLVTTHGAPVAFHCGQHDVVDFALDHEQFITALERGLHEQPETFGGGQVQLNDLQQCFVHAAGGRTDMLRRRPDVIAAERTLAASNARIGEAISDYYPKFSLGALLGSATNVSGNLLSGDSNLAQGVFGLRWRLFDFGRVKAEVEFAKGRDAEALAAYQQTLLQATADVENAMTQLVQSEQQNAVLEDGVRSLTEARQSAYSAFQQGSVSFIEVLDADDRLQQAQEQKLLAQSAAAVAAVDCFKSLGGGWNGPQGAVVAKATM